MQNLYEMLIATEADLKSNLKGSPSLFTHAKSAINQQHEYVFLKTSLKSTEKAF
jgi:hypothetical protein